MKTPHQIKLELDAAWIAFNRHKIRNSGQADWHKVYIELQTVLYAAEAAVAALPVVKTSAAAAKGAALYAHRHGEAAADRLSYGQLSYIGFLSFDGDAGRLEKELAASPAL